MKKPILGDKAVMKRYGDLLADIKTCIRQAQNRAVMSANAKMIRMYCGTSAKWLPNARNWKVGARAYCDGWRSILRKKCLILRVFPSEISNS